MSVKGGRRGLAQVCTATDNGGAVDFPGGWRENISVSAVQCDASPHESRETKTEEKAGSAKAAAPAALVVRHGKSVPSDRI